MSPLRVYSGDCCLCDVGIAAGIKDVNGVDLVTGDIVVIYTDNYTPDHLTVVIKEQYANLTGEPPEFFVMGIKDVPLHGPNEWRVLRVKAATDVIEGEKWPDYGFSYRSPPAHRGDDK